MSEAIKTVCVVDDDPAVLDSLKLFLEWYGFAVRDFSSGSAFLAADAETSPDCLVLDLNMPVVSGSAVLDELARRSLRIPTILITGQADEDARRRAEEGAVFALVLKPFDSLKLVDTVAQAIASGSRSEDDP